MIELTQRPNQSQRQEKARKTILVVDNEPLIRDLCRKVLDEYHVVDAPDGEKALEIFMCGGIDVILTDVRMPKLDGLELLRRLKELEPTVVVIIMTGFADKELILRALKEDADDFIIKPPTLLQLKSTIHKALVKQELKEEIATLRNQDKFKTNFLSLVSHKFRTPITSVSLFLQNLAAGIYDPADPVFQENLGLVYGEACYLGQLVTDLLSFSSVMDGGGLHPEPVDLGTLVAKCLNGSKEWPGKPGVTSQYDLEPVPELLLDREKFCFALQQVIDNAIKFSKETGVVRVTLQQLDESCRITVEDSGIGIAHDQLPKIFEKFYQVDANRAGQVRGFGLGLFYAREFIRMHNGSISIASGLNKGTRVVITLPTRAGQGA